eukprot:TRINITY_DN5502_c0_g1_i1.p2 TRINITY_DN5502_c0_g1~~TRINITY_DN5502_c0_g1_i1.p2  ORF type:complete len:109 (-),score=11.21 TRINITY_DN5502_c0_g1_i1:345-671(-)
MRVPSCVDHEIDVGEPACALYGSEWEVRGERWPFAIPFHCSVDKACVQHISSSIALAKDSYIRIKCIGDWVALYSKRTGELAFEWWNVDPQREKKRLLSTPVEKQRCQ